MLTKKQLEDAAECLARFHERTCIQCSCSKFHYGYVGAYGCAENAAQTALAYREMLEQLEWTNNDYCPICRQYKVNGHAADCKLAALLKESECEKG